MRRFGPPPSADEIEAIARVTLAALPAAFRDSLGDIIFSIEEFADAATLRDMGIDDPFDLSGLYEGIPLTERSVEGQSGILSDSILIYREGILAMATDRRGRTNETELQRQIRITILHELGHHFGMTEDDLAELGYD